MKTGLVLALVHVCIFAVLAEANNFVAWLMDDHVVIAFGLYLSSMGLTILLGLLLIGDVELVREFLTHLTRWWQHQHRPSKR